MFSKKEIDLNLRSEPDFWAKSIHRFAAFSWYLALIALIIACILIPPVQNFLNDTFALELKSNGLWILHLLEFCVLATILLISSIGLLINTLRHRRRTDKYYRPLVIFPILSALCIIIYLLIMKKIY